MSAPRVTIGVDTAYSAQIREALRLVGSTVLDTMRDEADRVVADARMRWPVARPRTKGGRLPNPVHSRDRFEITERLGEGYVDVVVANDAPYAFYIRSMQNQLGGKSAFVTLIRKPMHDGAKRIADESGHEVAKLIGGG